MDFLHPTWSGLCLGNIINSAYVVLTFLQLRSPAEPLLVKGSGGTMTFNNAHGYCFPYGKLPYVVPSELQDEEEQVVKLGRVGDGLGTIVNGAVSSASWYSGCWDALRALGTSLAPSTSDKPAHNRPSHYSSRSMLAGEVDYMRKKLGTTLPADVWPWYMVVAGRSELSNSFQTYIGNFNKAFRTGLSYATAVGSRFASVVFRSKMLGRSPVLGNSAVCESLDPADLVEAAKLGRMYQANKCTPAIRDHLHSLAAQKGLCGML